MENFSTVLSAYMEVGILGLIAILMIIIFYKMYKRDDEQHNKKDERIDKKDEQLSKNADDVYSKMLDMITTMQKQNEEFYRNQAHQNEKLIERIVRDITSHVPSKDENDKLTEINNNIDTLLKEILVITKADRASLVQYHNGGKGINKQAFLKMSITNEQIQLGVRPFIQEFKDQFRSVLGYFVQEINTKGYCYIEDTDSMLEKDIGMYEFMKNRGLCAKYGYAINSNFGYTLGFVCIEFLEKDVADVNVIDKCFKEYHRGIERLLNA